MKSIYLQLAESYESLAKSYRSLADAKEKADVPQVVDAVEQADKPVDIIDIRRVLAEKTQAGKSAEVKALLLKYGANKLSAVAPENFTSLLKEAEEL